MAKKDAEKAEIGEAAERRLKAALAAKREPTAVQTEGDATTLTNNVDLNSIKQDTLPEVCATEDVKESEELDNSTSSQSCWIPELAALFEECKVAAPGNVYEVIG